MIMIWGHEDNHDNLSQGQIKSMFYGEIVRVEQARFSTMSLNSIEINTDFVLHMKINSNSAEYTGYISLG